MANTIVCDHVPTHAHTAESVSSLHNECRAGYPLQLCIFCPRQFSHWLLTMVSTSKREALKCLRGRIAIAIAIAIAKGTLPPYSLHTVVQSYAMPTQP
eukprot:1142708-Pelagomonas_calceolata.AAC.1